MAAHELAVAQQQLVLLGRKTAAERIATFLLLRAEQSETASGEKASVVDLAMNRSDIADFLAWRRSAFSRLSGQAAHHPAPGAGPRRDPRPPVA